MVVALHIYAQSDKGSDTYVCSNGKIKFFASTPLEDIDATSKMAVCAINTKTKKVSVKVQMSTFEFRRKKMQDDFNEDYIESNKFPYATLDGMIVEGLDFTKDGTYDVTVKGTLEMHGVKLDREVKGKLTVKNGHPYSCTSTFDVRVADHKIKIPTIVIVKIAEVAKVNADFIFEKYNGSAH